MNLYPYLYGRHLRSFDKWFMKFLNYDLVSKSE